MKKQRDFKTYLNDIYASIEKGISFIKDMTYEEFEKDEKTQFAFVVLQKLQEKKVRKYQLK